MPTPSEIAQWMIEEFNKHGRLDQYAAACHISREFGEENVYRNKTGGTGIKKEILTEFRKLTPDDVVWDKSYKEWRRRTQFDPVGKRITN